MGPKVFGRYGRAWRQDLEVSKSALVEVCQQVVVLEMVAARARAYFQRMMPEKACLHQDLSYHEHAGLNNNKRQSKQYLQYENIWTQYMAIPGQLLTLYTSQVIE